MQARCVTLWRRWVAWFDREFSEPQPDTICTQCGRRYEEHEFTGNGLTGITPVCPRRERQEPPDDAL